ncbi:MAG TPA: hypothetical protein VNV88_01555 [Candidatus Solibacter sp.]|nr:hypothetical protein [Candidatus Solibacter sp.]
MNRRNLLKKAGISALAAPFIAGTLLDRSTAQSVSSRPLMISFCGPFVLGSGATRMSVMAPPIGPADPDAPHQPWLGTTASEALLQGVSSMSLSMHFTPDPQPLTAGVPIITYSQPMNGTSPQALGQSPLFTLDLPVPDLVAGIHPIEIVRGTCPTTNNAIVGPSETVASAFLFLYRQVDLSSVTLTGLGCNPDFHIDTEAALPCAMLGVHLTPLFTSDPDHMHAAMVVGKMKSMLPWITDCIDLPSVPSCGLVINAAVGDDCKAPVIRI